MKSNNIDRKDIDNLCNNPEKFLPIDESGDFHIERLNKKYAARRLQKNMYIFEMAYKVLTDGKHFSEKKAFGEMHGDCYLWVEKHDKIQVIIYQAQSYRHIYIKDGSTFHIRSLDYSMNYPSYEKTRLKGITIAKFKKQGFEPFCSNDVNKRQHDFEAFTYGDARDAAYILSGTIPKASHFGIHEGVEKPENIDAEKFQQIKELRAALDIITNCDYVNTHTLRAISNMEYWLPYLNGEEELE